jgi:hypothetical protein
MRAQAIGGGVGVFVAISAARAASWLGDAAKFNVVYRTIVADMARGRVIAAQRTALAARLAAFEGRRADAMRGYSAADRQWQDLGLDWDRALTLYDMVAALGPGAETAAAAGQARSIFERLGAAPMLRKLEATLASPEQPVPEATRAARTAGGVVSTAAVPG